MPSPRAAGAPEDICSGAMPPGSIWVQMATLQPVFAQLGRLASPYALAKLAKMLEHDDPADFSLDLALKDLDLSVPPSTR